MAILDDAIRDNQRRAVRTGALSSLEIDPAANNVFFKWIRSIISSILDIKSLDDVPLACGRNNKSAAIPQTVNNAIFTAIVSRAK